MDKKVTYELVASYFSGNCTISESQIIEKWKDESPENYELFTQYKAIWENAQRPEKLFSPDIEKALHKVNRELLDVPENSRRKKVVSLISYPLRIAAAIIIGIGIWLTYWLLNPKNETVQLIALSKGVKTEVSLADGTHVWLNSNSLLRYPEKFEGKYRKVYIEGEAYFDVTKNPQMPFIIETKHSIVQVLGTSFNLRARNNDILTSVTVFEGRVSFTGRNKIADKIVYLTAGDKGLLNNSSNKLEIAKTEDSNDFAWKTGKLVFNNSPLEQVTEDLSNYFGVKIYVDEPRQKRIPFTSTFESQNLNEILDIIKLSLGVQVDSTNQVIKLK